PEGPQANGDGHPCCTRHQRKSIKGSRRRRRTVCDVEKWRTAPTIRQKETETMKYMLMMNAPRGSGDWSVVNWSADDFKAHIAFMKDFAKELGQAGELVGLEGLASPDQAKVVRASKSGAPEVTDGPFPESKEFLAGYWIVDVEGPQRAYAIA